METEPGYYVVYRTTGKGDQLRLLTERMPTSAPGKSPQSLRRAADHWRRFHQDSLPNREVLLIQVLEPLP